MLRLTAALVAIAGAAAAGEASPTCRAAAERMTAITVAELRKTGRVIDDDRRAASTARLAVDLETLPNGCAVILTLDHDALVALYRARAAR